MIPKVALQKLTDLSLSSFVWSRIAHDNKDGCISSVLATLGIQTPDTHIPEYGPEEGAYMERYWILPYKDEPYWADVHGVRLHIIKRPDHDRLDHNHPWPFRSMILRGWYFEDSVEFPGAPRNKRLREAGSSYLMNVDSYHSISMVSPEPIITLCLLGKKNGQKWGFLDIDAYGNWIHIPAREHSTSNQEEVHIAESAKESKDDCCRS